MSELGQGLSLSGIGILITFCALGILIGLIVLLKALFPTRDEASDIGEAAVAGARPGSPEREAILKKAAGVGVAVLMKKENRSGQGSLGSLLETPVTEWWRKGVDRVQGKE